MKRIKKIAIYFVLSLIMVIGAYSLNTMLIEASETGEKSPTVLVPYQEVTEYGTYIVPSPGRIEITGYGIFGGSIKSLSSGEEYRYLSNVRIPAGEYELRDFDKAKYIPESSSEYEQENNDTFDSANPILTNILYKGSSRNFAVGGTIDLDDDYYKLVINEKGSLYTELSYQLKGSQYLTLIYQLYSESADGNVSLIASQEINNRNIKTTRVRIPKGNYYIRIFPYYTSGSNAEVEYTLKTIYNEEPSDEFETEDNDIKEKANEIAINKKYIGNLNMYRYERLYEIKEYKDIDYYKFSLENVGKLQLQMTTPRQKADGLFTAELLSANGKVLDRINSDSNPTIYGKTKILDVGDYYVKVYSSNDSYDSHIDYSIMCAFEEKVLADDISITSKKTKFNVGEKFNLSAKILPENASDKTIVWKSLDTKIASIDKKGTLKCKKAGEVIIRATAKDNADINDELHITVNAVKKKKTTKVKYAVPEKIYNKIKGWYSESSSAGYDVKVTRDYFIKYDRNTGKVSSRMKIHKMKTINNGYLFCVKQNGWEIGYFCEKSKLSEGFDYLMGWDGDWIGYSGSASLSKGKWGSSE